MNTKFANSFSKYSLVISCVLLFSISLNGPAFAQVNHIESEDSLKIRLIKSYIQWSHNYGAKKQFDSANKYSNKALVLEKEVSDEDLSALVYSNHARMLYWQSKTKDAHVFLDRNINSPTITDSIKAQSHYLKSEIYEHEQKDHKAALEQALAGQHIIANQASLSRGDSLFLMNTSLLMAGIQKEAKNVQQALFHYDEAINYCSDGGFKTYIQFYKAEILKTERDLEQSIKLVEEALVTAQEKEFHIYVPTFCLALSEYYLELNDPDNALYYANLGLMDNVDCRIDGLNNNAGLSYLGLSDDKKAIAYFKAALGANISEIPQSTIHKNLSTAYKNLGEFDKALLHHTLYSKLQDSVNEAKSKQDIFEISEKYQSEKKTLEIDMLQLKDESNQQVISKQKWVLLFISLSLLLTLLLSGLILKYYLKQKKQRALLFEKNLQLVHKLKKAEMKNSLDEKTIQKANTTIDGQKWDAIILKIENGVKQQFYLNKDTTLISFAKEIDTNTTYLSKIVNEKFHKPFTHFVNDLRIQFMLQKIENDHEYRTFTIDYISEDIGFSSSSAFYAAFKKYTGLTPSYYIKKRLTILE